MTIEQIFTKDRAALAPLAGITGSVFRRICRRYGAQPVMTEMVSADGLFHRGCDRTSARLLSFHESERPIGIQLFGSDPGIMEAAAKRVLEHDPDFIDINAGCPVRKVIAKGAGSALLTTPDILADIVARISSVSDVPITVKIRSGWDHDNINAVDISRRCEEAGAAAIIVHPRTRSQGFSGHGDWAVIRDVKKAVTIPVVGSGDIETPEDAMRMLDETGCDSVMIGRRAMGDPWIFKRVAERLSGVKVSEKPPVADRLDLALEQLDMITEEISERFAVLNMRKFFGWYSKGARDGASFRQEVFRAETIDEVRRIVAAFQKISRELDSSDIHNRETVIS